MGLIPRKLNTGLIGWLSKEIYDPPHPTYYNYEQMKYEVRVGDVLLVEGRSRISRVINWISSSPWTHAALYIGRLYDIQDPHLRQLVYKHYQGAPEEQLVIESLLGKGVIVTPLSFYRKHHVRICRPRGLNFDSAQKVSGYVIARLGVQYSLRHIFDLARFLFPWPILPRQWRSSLFAYQAGVQTRLSCSLLIAEAFASIKFPLLPLVQEKGDKGLEFIRRNPTLFTPSDFDYSPYFDIIKYPLVGSQSAAPYENIPWAEDGIFSNDHGKIMNLKSSQKDEK